MAAKKTYSPAEVALMHGLKDKNGNPDGLKVRKACREDRKFYQSPGFGGRYALTAKQIQRLRKDKGWKLAKQRKQRKQPNSVRKHGTGSSPTTTTAS